MLICEKYQYCIHFFKLMHRLKVYLNCFQCRSLIPSTWAECIVNLSYTIKGTIRQCSQPKFYNMPIRFKPGSSNVARKHSQSSIKQDCPLPTSSSNVGRTPGQHMHTTFLSICMHTEPASLDQSDRKEIMRFIYFCYKKVYLIAFDHILFHLRLKYTITKMNKYIIQL